MAKADLKWRVLADDNFEIILGVIVVVALVGGYLTYSAYLDPGTTIEERQVDSWESTGKFTHRATVVNGSEAYPAGTVLQDRSAYFRGASPTLDGAFHYRYRASDGGEVTADTEIALVLRSVESGDGTNETVFWRTEDELASDQVRSLGPGERFDAPFSLDVDEAADRTERIDTQLGGTPGQLDVSIVAEVSLSGTVNGRAIERTREYRLPISFRQGVYQVQDPGSVVASGGQTETVRVHTEPGPIGRVGGPVLLVVALVGSVGLVVARRRGVLSVSQTERELHAYESARNEFDEWISTARLPDLASDESLVEVDTLTGLVDLAIDSDRRVIEDVDTDVLVVYDDRFTYVYSPPDAEADRPVGRTTRAVFSQYQSDRHEPRDLVTEDDQERSE